MTLPAWFERINVDFRDRLTLVGAPAPDLHVAAEIVHNEFGITGSLAGLEVCWQVTASRADPWSGAKPLVVEGDKDRTERGYLLHPSLYGRPESEGITAALTSPALMPAVNSGAEASLRPYPPMRLRG